MKRLIPALFCVLMIGPMKAQENSFVMEPESPTVIGKLSLISPKLIAEIAPSDYFTLNIGFWLKTNFWDYEDWQPSSGGYITPSFRLEPRYFFNLEDRQEKGKSTRYYSGWYISLPFDIEFPDLRYSMGGSIGFQYTMGRRWYWNISMGPGFSYYDTRFHWTGAGEFGLGIILNKM
jgi:hypothetical protein